MEALTEIVSDGDALRERLRLRIAHVLIEILLHLPFIQRMRFANVDGEKIGVVFVIVIHLHQIADLAAEGRSSVAAENEDKGARAHAIVDIKTGGATERDEGRIRRTIAYLKIALVPLRKGVTEETVQIAGTAHEIAADAEGDRE